ncbi:hypothetical protein FJT64_024751 [Amphibalanus amphitrite]|uniref:Fibrinogen C-terminal domain-containing protein n=1 Tax=Amphibalanus amphitrite TaxID=1232801 RepID=A0A6A4W7C1_AMPAM|nr:hypothetical protein FJT64_024751 [Amphibalanus amphitrite]
MSLSRLCLLAAAAGLSVAAPAGPECFTEPRNEPSQLPERVCDFNPDVLPADGAPYDEPAVRACARSCRQLREQGGKHQDGVYWFTGMPVPVYCDFSHDGGGWTLLLTAVSADGWDALSALGRSRRSPTLTDNYSILAHADAIRDLGHSARFAYRIEAQVETGRQRWGGVWLAPRHYSFIHESPSQTDVTIVRKFDEWEYKDIGIEKRMPWLSTDSAHDAVLTTSASVSVEWWGTLVSHKTHTYYKHSPWLNGEAMNSGTMLYWMREEEL